MREKARNVIELLQDNARIREERDKARQLRDKFRGFSGQRDNNFGRYNNGNDGRYGGSGNDGAIGGFYSGGSYANGGIGSDSFDTGAARFSGNSGERVSRFNDGGRSLERNGDNQSSGGNGRYSDDPTTTVHTTTVAEQKSRKFDIKINTQKLAVPQALDRPHEDNAANADSAIRPDAPPSSNNNNGDLISLVSLPPAAPESDFDSFQVVSSLPAVEHASYPVRQNPSSTNGNDLLGSGDLTAFSGSMLSSSSNQTLPLKVREATIPLRISSEMSCSN